MPKRPPAAALVLDNASFHKRSDTGKLIIGAGHTLEYLPPYSPDLNKIEPTWASIVDPYCLAGHEPGALAIRPFHPIIDYGFSMLVPRTFRNLPEIRSFRENLIVYCQSGARWLPGSEATAGRSSI